MVDMLKTYVMDIPGAVSGVSLDPNILVLDDKGLEEEAIDLRYDV
jgi:hypothetical protein